jgi:hypothetical protein
MKGPVIRMSGDAADKLAACFAWACHSSDPTEQRYFDACARSWSMLTPQNEDVVRTIIDVLASPHKDAAEGMAAGLPEAPKRPAQLISLGRKARLTRCLNYGNFVPSAVSPCLLILAPITSRYGWEIGGRVSGGSPPSPKGGGGDDFADCAGRAIGRSHVLGRTSPLCRCACRFGHSGISI